MLASDFKQTRYITNISCVTSCRLAQRHPDPRHLTVLVRVYPITLYVTAGSFQDCQRDPQYVCTVLSGDLTNMTAKTGLLLSPLTPLSSYSTASSLPSFPSPLLLSPLSSFPLSSLPSLPSSSPFLLCTQRLGHLLELISLQLTRQKRERIG